MGWEASSLGLSPALAPLQSAFLNDRNLQYFQVELC